MTFYATFGQGQYAGTLKDSYVRLEVDDAGRNAFECQLAAQRCMNTHFPKWSAMYSVIDFDASKFPKGMLACLDEHGNRLFSKEG